MLAKEEEERHRRDGRRPGADLRRSRPREARARAGGAAAAKPAETARPPVKGKPQLGQGRGPHRQG